MYKKLFGLMLICGGIISNIYGITYNNSTEVQLNNAFSRYGIGSQDMKGIIFIIIGIVAIIIGIVLLVPINKRNEDILNDSIKTNSNPNDSDNLPIENIEDPNGTATLKYKRIIEELSKEFNLYISKVYSIDQYNTKKNMWIENLKELDFNNIETDFLTDIVPILKEGGLDSNDLNKIKYIVSGKYASDKIENEMKELRRINEEKIEKRKAMINKIKKVIVTALCSIRDFIKNHRKILIISSVSIVALIIMIISINTYKYMQYPDIGKIKNDLVGKYFTIDNSSELYTIKDGQIKKVDVIKSTIDNKSKIDDIFIKIQISDGKVNMSGDLEINYNYYKKDGWKFEGIKGDKISDFNYSFETGYAPNINEEEIKKDIIGQNILLSNGNMYSVKKEEIKDVKIANKTEYIDNSGVSEQITVNVLIENNAMSISGNLNISYLFKNDASWIYSNAKNIDGTKLKITYALTTEDKIKSDLVGQSFIYDDTDWWDTKVCTIESGEIKELQITRRDDSNSSTDVIYANITLAASNEIPYEISVPVKIIYNQGDTGWVFYSISKNQEQSNP